MGAVARTLDGQAVPKTARILLAAPPAGGGLAHHVVSLLAGLDRDGYPIGVACPHEGVIAEAARERGIPVYAVNIAERGGFRQTLIAAVQLTRARRAFEARIIHTHSYRASLAGALAMLGAGGARLVATIHNYPPGPRTLQARGTRRRWAMGLIVRRASRVIAVSEALRHELVAMRPGVAVKSVTIPNGVDTRAETKADPGQVRASCGLPAAGPVIGMIARLAPGKGIREFIQACGQIADQWPEVCFVLGGDGPLRDEARALRKELGLAHRLCFTGEVSAARDLLEAMDVLVVASSSEGSSVVAMEAMSAGKPVVATAVGGVSEVVADGETGILVRPEDPAVLAQALETLLGQPELAQKMGERGRQRAAQLFDVRLMLQRTKEVYAGVLREEIEAGGAPR